MRPNKKAHSKKLDNNLQPHTQTQLSRGGRPLATRPDSIRICVCLLAGPEGRCFARLCNDNKSASSSGQSRLVGANEKARERAKDNNEAWRALKHRLCNQPIRSSLTGGSGITITRDTGRSFDEGESETNRFYSFSGSDRLGIGWPQVSRPLTEF